VAEFGGYSEKVLDHYQNPRNAGEIEGADGVGIVGNPVCGDMMKITIKVRDSRIEDVKFKTFGCVAAIATTSMVTELVRGKTLEEALHITNQDVIEALDGLPPIKKHCSLLAEEAIKAAIEDYRGKDGQRR
jgi:nitrogen fixation NifU-like protein